MRKMIYVGKSSRKIDYHDIIWAEEIFFFVNLRRKSSSIGLKLTSFMTSKRRPCDVSR